MLNFRCLGCGMTNIHHPNCYAKRFDLDARMPKTLTMAEETERHNRSEFERQGRIYGYQLVRTSVPRAGQRTLTVTPLPSAAQQIGPAKTLANAITEASMTNFSASDKAVRRIAASLSLPDVKWVKEAMAKVPSNPSIGRDENEAVFEFTRHELASLLDGSVRFALFERVLSNWYDVRLEDYAFRCETFRQVMVRNAPVPIPIVADTTAHQPENPVDQAVPAPRIIRLRIADLSTVTVWDRDDDVSALTDVLKDMGAGLFVKRNGKCIDIEGSPTETSKILLELGDREVRLTIAPDFAVINEKYLISDADLGNASDYEREEPDWQLQFMMNEAPPRFEMRYNANYYIILLTNHSPIQRH